MGRDRAQRRGETPSEMQSMQLPGHWYPMRAQEGCRLADICTRPGEEYNGDLEGWEVEWLSLVSVCVSHLHRPGNLPSEPCLCQQQLVVKAGVYKSW